MGSSDLAPPTKGGLRHAVAVWRSRDTGTVRGERTHARIAPGTVERTHSRTWRHTAGTLTTGRFASYLGDVDDPIIARSALKHGLGEEEILHAYRNPIRSWDLGDGFIMLIGANAAAIILEVGYVHGATAVVIVHAMPAREKFLR